MSDEGAVGAGLIFKGKPELKEPVVKALKTVYDPEIPVDIYELGLIYTVSVDDDGAAQVEMTLTSPACPSAEQIPAEVQERVASVAGIISADVAVVWEPTWNPEFMSDVAKVELGMY